MEYYNDRSSTAKAAGTEKVPPFEVVNYVRRSKIYEVLIRDGHYSWLSNNDWRAKALRVGFEESVSMFAKAHPDTFDRLASQSIDSFHGTTSLNIHDILRRGLAPSGDLSRLGVIALGREMFTRPDARMDLHVVPLGSIDQTRMYAEERLNPHNWDMVNPYNYEAIDRASEVFNDSLSDDMSTITRYYLGRKEEASRFRDLANSGKLDGEPYPIVIGFSSTELDEQMPIRRCESGIVGDTAIRGVVTPEKLRYFFVPDRNTDDISILLNNTGLECTVESIRNIR